MKNAILFILFLLVSTAAVHAQKWDDLSDEQKLMKLKTFREESHKYMKDSLKLTPTQISDVDDINLCFLATLDRIVRYGKNEENQNKLAEAVSQARWVQIDVIMGEAKHDKYAAYLERRIAQLKK